MMYLPPPAMTRRTKKGFSLLETAVVLGVVGLVIGGIWVAASTVTRENQVNTAFSDITGAIAKLDRYEMWQLNDYLTAPMPSRGANVTALGLYDSTFSYTGWGIFRTAKHQFQFDMPSATGSLYFKATISAPSAAACASLLSKLIRYYQSRGATTDGFANGLLTSSPSGIRYFCPFQTGSQNCIFPAATSNTSMDVIAAGCDAIIINASR